MDTSNFTYGAEHELGDWDQSRFYMLRAQGFAIDKKDITVMNSNGIAADGHGVTYGFGGEINTPPSNSIKGQVTALGQIKAVFPEATVNHRSNLHIHVRVPGLELQHLKKLALFGYLHLKNCLLPKVEPIPRPTREQYPIEEEYQGAMRRYRRRRVSHQTVITHDRLAKQLNAVTLEDFFAAECPTKGDGTPLWHLAPRHAVNLRHLREETGTIEFRHFPGTLDERLLANCVSWCRDYLVAALTDQGVSTLLERDSGRVFPTFPEYVHWREVNYRKTVNDGTVPREQIAANIKAILAQQ